MKYMFGNLLVTKLCLLGVVTLLIGCSDSGSSDSPILTQADLDLAELIADQSLSDDPRANRDLPDIEDPVAALGRALFFTKSLGGDFDSACVTCHHPMLGGGDDLSLPVGVGAVNENVLGPGREHHDGLPEVPRNSPTAFNVGLWDTSLFWDSRVESIGKELDTNGASSGIRTPDSDFLLADPNAGANLVAAQARFPITSAEEMKGETFENGSDNDTIRNHLAARIGDYGVGLNELETNDWLEAFQQAFGVTAGAEDVVTFDNIAQAIGEYERSMVFVDSPWRRYLEGDTTALTEDQKAGAILFFTRTEDDGAGCSGCHNGPLLSDGSHQTVAFPHFGPGKGDGLSDDFGRERETQDSDDRYRFRVPSLLNIAATAPYGHVGPYETLAEVVRHYNNPQRHVDRFFENGGWCQLEQYDGVANCMTLYPNAEANSQLALDKLDQERQNRTSRLPNINLNDQAQAQLVSFLESLTDPCVTDRECMAPWIATNENDNFDNQLLIAVDVDGNPL